jgi:hypothetical protein
MLRLLTDENVDHRIVRALLRRLPALDWISVQSSGMTGFSDDWILEYASSEGRIVITHDIRTMPAHATDRIKKNLYLPGLIVVPDTLDIATAVNDLEVLIECVTEDEFQNRIYFLPI